LRFGGSEDGKSLLVQMHRRLAANQALQLAHEESTE